MSGLTDAEPVEFFMSEGCPQLALALHARTGWPLAILWDDGQSDDWGMGDEPVPAHVFVVDPTTGEAVDARGRRPVAAVKADFHDLVEPNVDDRVTARELEGLMGDRRPFYAVDAVELEQVGVVVDRLGLLG